MNFVFGRKRKGQFAATTVSMVENIDINQAAQSVQPPKVPTKPASDVVAGAVARAASQSTIHPLDTIKVRLQARFGDAVRERRSVSAVRVRYGRLEVRPALAVRQAQKQFKSLYKGVAGAAGGAGIAIGAYFAVYGVASNSIARYSNLPSGGVAFLAGAIAAAGSSVVKVPIAVCVRSVQAGLYSNPFEAAGAICRQTGPRGLFTGFLPTLLEDVPDMAFKFAAYETLRQLHQKAIGRGATVQEDFALGAVAGAFAAGMTTPLDVVKTSMMIDAVYRPTIMTAAKNVYAIGGAKAFFSGVTARATSNGINSAVFFCFFEILRKGFAEEKLKNSKKRAEGLQRKQVGMVKETLKR